MAIKGYKYIKKLIMVFNNSYLYVETIVSWKVSNAGGNRKTKIIAWMRLIKIHGGITNDR